MHVNDAHSQVMGQKARQSNHSTAEDLKKDIKCFYVFLFGHIIREVNLCRPVDGKQASFLSVEVLSCQVGVRCPDCFLILQLST